MRILLSNDDGVHASGIQQLAHELRLHAYDVQIIAPDLNRSGASSALTLDMPLRTHRYSNGDIAVQRGTPTDSVYLGVNCLMEPKPEIVISGINAGPNLGDDVIYSGTVAAAIEGRHLGLPAIAVSLNGTANYKTAAVITCQLLKRLQDSPIYPSAVLNINVPDLPLAQIKGWKVTRCGERHPANQVIVQQDPRGDTLYWIGPQGKPHDAGEGTDFDAVAQGYVSITPLGIDLTAHDGASQLAGWLTKAEVNVTC